MAYHRVDEVEVSHDAVVCITASLAERDSAHPEGIEVGGAEFLGLAPAIAALIVEGDIYPSALVLD